MAVWCHPCLSHLWQRVVTTVWHPRVHGVSFREVKRIVATLRLGCAHLRTLGPLQVSRSLPFPLWGGDVMAYVGPLWDEGADGVTTKKHEPSTVGDRLQTAGGNYCGNGRRLRLLMWGATGSVSWGWSRAQCCQLS